MPGAAEAQGGDKSYNSYKSYKGGGAAPRRVIRIIGLIRFMRLMRDYRASVDFELEAFFDEEVEEGACDLDFARG